MSVKSFVQRVTGNTGTQLSDKGLNSREIREEQRRDAERLNAWIAAAAQMHRN
ncbi:hypothetical protein [Corynebacterium lubricantis]|uniref:hypothetical protein n=1 Tax=Corynebacterium lubricantis TaxID=541095 RepID=UPI0003695C27|nr:hypothetical protein [Corynebacterium lubricantis]